ncbi:hypothetical protein PENTCL1PPCAC_20185 [Pristionchus entomophagus]|uniref:Ribosomal protein n=1 Tax=Pristionchus entomophagus TaxID=358040 RepID=A0AAV5TUR9_9BILA|nr:hypothetical protein PENTCL1PPCAC_20185 [Pristionchus entomophagus]
MERVLVQSSGVLYYQLLIDCSPSINNPKYKTNMCKNYEPGANGECATHTVQRKMDKDGSTTYTMRLHRQNRSSATRGTSTE